MANPIPDGDSQFSRGINSNADPAQLPEGFSFVAINLVNRGGIWQARPGFKWLYNLPPGRRLQGCHLFRPITGLEQMLAAVDGIIYTSVFPFQTYVPIQGIAFRPDVEQVFFCTADKSVNVNEDLSLTVVTPFKVAIIQDGSTPPGIFDGSNARHLTKSNETPIGSHMLWTSDRLWVARGRELFVSDINDPSGNNEQQYFGAAKSFLLDRPITGLAEVTYSANATLVAFTDMNCTAFKSHLRRRADWPDPDVEFQKVLFPSIGCLSSRSITTRNGLLHWWSQYGQMRLDAAMTTLQTSEIRFTDTEMAFSKSIIGPPSGIASASFENYLLTSVPAADPYNAHTWVSDAGPMETRGADSPEAWQGVWTGIRPVEWQVGQVQGETRIFAASVDFDGAFRVWEAFVPERKDNGCPIQWALYSRGYTNGNLADKDFRYSDLHLQEISGVVDLRVQWAGVSRGAFKDIMAVRFRAEEGIVNEALIVTPETPVYALKKQSRVVRTRDVKIRIEDTDTTSCGIESDKVEFTDAAHMLRILGSGQCGIRMIRVNTDPGSEREEKSCPEDEASELHFVRQDGRAAHSIAELNEHPIDRFSSTQLHSIEAAGEEYIASATAMSRISQRDADKVAACHARSDAVEWYLAHAPLVSSGGSGSSS